MAGMQPVPLALGAATMAAFAAIIGLAVHGEVVQHLPSLFLDTEVLAKVSILVSLAVFVWAALPPSRSGDVIHQLHSMAMLAGGLGLLFTVVAFSSPELIDLDPTKVDMLKEMGSTYAQDLMPLAFGLLAATAATARAGRRPAGA